jgi:DNA-binding helix-hairpin-helix protein with protein kinase domain
MKSTINNKQIQQLYLGRDIFLGRELASGGEGIIYTVDRDTQSVAKILHQSSLEKTQKLETMIAKPPRDLTWDTLQQISIAWPQALIIDSKGTCVGFTMPYIAANEFVALHKIYTPRDRRGLPYIFTWQHLLRMAQNLALVLEELHSKNYVVGDLNESNIYGNPDALVALLDCDSMQVPKPQGHGYFRCTVGKPEYTPPELQGRDFSAVDREPNHDNFALSVLIFMMLMEGRHPFAGVWHGNGMAPTLAQNIQNKEFPYGGRSKLTTPKKALPFDTLPPSLQKLFMRSFTQKKRPTATDWVKALEAAEGQLEQCQNVDENGRQRKYHWYSNHLSECPWCMRMALGLPDPFPLEIQSQVVLPENSPRQLVQPQPPVIQLRRPAAQQPATQRPAQPPATQQRATSGASPKSSQQRAASGASPKSPQQLVPPQPATSQPRRLAPQQPAPKPSAPPQPQKSKSGRSKPPKTPERKPAFRRLLSILSSRPLRPLWILALFIIAMILLLLHFLGATFHDLSSTNQIFIVMIIFIFAGVITLWIYTQEAERQKRSRKREEESGRDTSGGDG